MRRSDLVLPLAVVLVCFGSSLARCGIRFSLEGRLWNAAWDLGEASCGSSEITGPVLSLQSGHFSFVAGWTQGEFAGSGSEPSFDFDERAAAMSYKISSNLVLFSAYKRSKLSGPNPVSECQIKYEGLNAGIAAALPTRARYVFYYVSASIAPYTRVSTGDSTIAWATYLAVESGLLAASRHVVMKFGFAYLDRLDSRDLKFEDRRRGLVASLTLRP